MIVRQLSFEPRGELRKPIGERDPRLEAENFLGKRDIRKTVAHVAHSIFARDLWKEVALAHSLRHGRRDLQDGARLAAADVDDTAGGLAPFERKDTSARHVVNAHEIPHLEPI